MLVLSASLTQYFPSINDFLKSFDQGSNGTICSISPLRILDMFVMQNYADISTKNNNKGLFSEDNHRAFRDIHEETYSSAKHPKCVVFQHDEENDFEISYMQLSRKIKNRFIFQTW